MVEGFSEALQPVINAFNDIAKAFGIDDVSAENRQRAHYAKTAGTPRRRDRPGRRRR